MFVVTSITAFAEDAYCYVSNVKHYNDRVVVTVSAKSGAFDTYPAGFMVGVRPARHLLDARIITSAAEKDAKLSKESPSRDIIFWCDEGSTGKKACQRDDFVARSRR